MVAGLEIAFRNQAAAEPEIISSHRDMTLRRPCRGGKGLPFRVANGSDLQVTGIRAKVTFSRREEGGRPKHTTLELEWEHMTPLPAQWVVVHPIGKDSPLWGTTRDGLQGCAAEVFVRLVAMEEPFSQAVHARFSYAGEEIVYWTRFADLFGVGAGDALTVDVSQWSEVERAEWEHPTKGWRRHEPPAPVLVWAKTANAVLPG